MYVVVYIAVLLHCSCIVRGVLLESSRPPTGVWVAVGVCYKFWFWWQPSQIHVVTAENINIIVFWFVSKGIQIWISLRRLSNAMEGNIYLLVMRSGWAAARCIITNLEDWLENSFSAMNSVHYTVFVYKIDVKVANTPRFVLRERTRI